MTTSFGDGSQWAGEGGSMLQAARARGIVGVTVFGRSLDLLLPPLPGREGETTMVSIPLPGGGFIFTPVPGAVLPRAERRAFAARKERKVILLDDNDGGCFGGFGPTAYPATMLAWTMRVARHVIVWEGGTDANVVARLTAVVATETRVLIIATQAPFGAAWLDEIAERRTQHRIDAFAEIGSDLDRFVRSRTMHPGGGR